MYHPTDLAALVLWLAALGAVVLVGSRLAGNLGRHVARRLP